MRNRRLIHLACLVFGALMLQSVFACGSSAPSPQPFSASVSREPVTQRGLELQVLRVDDALERVASTLSSYDEQGAVVLSPQERSLWREWGFRWVCVPIAELDVVLGAQQTKGVVDTRWLGEFPRWRTLLRLSELGGARISAPGGVSRAMSGRPTLLARSWSMPEVTESGAVSVLRLDLALTLSASRSRSGTYSSDNQVGPGTLSVTLDGSHAMILIGEDPSAQWSDTGSSVAFDPAESGSRVRGPVAPIEPTLGERLFTTRGARPERVLIVLVPSVGPWSEIGVALPEMQPDPSRESGSGS